AAVPPPRTGRQAPNPPRRRRPAGRPDAPTHDDAGTPGRRAGHGCASRSPGTVWARLPRWARGSGATPGRSTASGIPRGPRRSLPLPLVERTQPLEHARHLGPHLLQRHRPRRRAVLAPPLVHAGHRAEAIAAAQRVPAPLAHERVLRVARHATSPHSVHWHDGPPGGP